MISAIKRDRRWYSFLHDVQNCGLWRGGPESELELAVSSKDRLWERKIHHLKGYRRSYVPRGEPGYNETQISRQMDIEDFVNGY